MSLWLSIIQAIVMTSIIVFVIADNRRPVYAIAWLLILVFLPVVGLVLFFLFGREPRHERLIGDADLKALKAFSDARAGERPAQAPAAYRELAGFLHASNHAVLIGGNQIRPYTAFQPMMDDLLADLESARHHIHMEFYIFEADEIGRQVADVLVRKAREGVEVRVQYDDFANFGHRSFFRAMRAAGVKVQPFIRITLPFLSPNTNYRNHRKVVVVDGRIAYLGGMNLARRYAEGLKWGNWRDTHMRIAGPVVAEAQTAFLVDWQFTSGDRLCDASYYPPVPPMGDSLVQIATSGPMDEWKVIMQAFLRMIMQAREYIYIQTPYFIPTEPVLLALRNAALAGVDVRVMIPARGDRGSIPFLASCSYVSYALAAGVKIGFYQKGFMHSKAIVSDDAVVSIGSTNIDVRSLELNFEVNAFIYDERLALEMKRVFLEDEKDAVYVAEAQWRTRPLWQKVRESVSRLVSPLL